VVERLPYADAMVEAERRGDFVIIQARRASGPKLS
jgi:hypothetical protein